MNVLNRIASRIFDALLSPLGASAPLATLAIVALLAAVGMLLLFRATSNQRRIAAAKRGIEAGLLELRLLNEDPRAVLRAQSDILRQNLRYVGSSLVPMVCVSLPLVLVIAQLQSFYGWRAFRPGESFVFESRLTPVPAGAAPGARPPVTLRLPAGLHAETADVWIPSLAKVVWRVRAEKPGRYTLEVESGGATLAKQVAVDGGFGRLSPRRDKPGIVSQLLYPAEAPLPRPQTIESLRIAYPSGTVAVFGREMSWMIPFLGFLTVFALLLKGPLRVTL